MLLVLFAPLLSAVALVAGGIASVVDLVFKGPRRRTHREPPMVVMPPIPTPEELARLEAEERARSAI